MGGCGELLYAHRGGECLFIARMMTASESSSLFSLPLPLSRVREGSVTFSRAITQIPNAMIRRNAFLFSAFYLSLSLLFEPRVCVVRAAAHARIEKKCFFPCFVRFFSFFITSFFGRANALWRHHVKTWAHGRSPGNGEHFSSVCGSTTRERPFPLSISHRRGRAERRLGAHDRWEKKGISVAGMSVDPNPEDDR